jgi:hypothetical protein
MKKIKMYVTAKVSFFASVVLISVGFFGSLPVYAETYYPVDNSFKEVLWAYDKNPCNKTEKRYVRFLNIGNKGREVISAKLYVEVKYSFVPPPDNEDDDTLEARKLDAGCDGSKFNNIYHAYRKAPLPNQIEVPIDLPLSAFSCEKEKRSYMTSFTHYKSDIVNQHAQIGKVRLEIEFGDSCPSPEPDPKPDPEPEPDSPKTGIWWRYKLETERINDFETVSGDYDGDGIDDVAMFASYSDNTTRVNVITSTGLAFKYEGDEGWWSSNDFNINLIKGKLTSGDYNGDGYDDIALIYNHRGYYDVADILISTGSSFQYRLRFGAWSPPGDYGMTGRPVTGDFNGDDVDDIAVFYSDSTLGIIFQVLSSDKSYFYERIWLNGSDDQVGRNGRRIVSGDFNGDGLDDITTISLFNNTARALVFLSTGTNFQHADLQGWWGTVNYNPSEITINDLMVGDFDRDGDDDIYILILDCLGNYDLDLLFSSGSSFLRYPGKLDGVKESGITHFAFGDYDNDGVNDIVRMHLYTEIKDGKVVNTPQEYIGWVNLLHDYLP